MTKTAILGSLVLLLAHVAGCAQSASQTPTRVVASGQRLVVEVSGDGAVVVGPEQTSCGRARCEIEWDRVADPVLVAQAAPGWKLDHWEIAGEEPLNPTFTDPSGRRTYRAVFVPEPRTTAQNGRSASQ